MMIASYIWSYSSRTISCKQHMIEEYCKENRLSIKHNYCDTGKRIKASTNDNWKAEKLGISLRKGRRTLPQWENLMVAITKKEIDTVLVCNKVELTSSSETAEVLNRILAEYNVTIVEVRLPSSQNLKESGNMAFLYHSSSALSRPVITIKELDDLIEFAATHDWQVARICVDTDIYAHHGLNQMIDTEKAGIMIFKCVMHISRHTEYAFSSLHRAADRGMRIMSIKEGELIFPDEIVSTHKKALAYLKHGKNEAKRIARKKLDLFTETKTFWSITGYTSRYSFSDYDDYDILLVEHIHDLGNDSVDLIRILRKIHRPVYSIKEGCIEIQYE